MQHTQAILDIKYDEAGLKDILIFPRTIADMLSFRFRSVYKYGTDFFARACNCLQAVRSGWEWHYPFQCVGDYLENNTMQTESITLIHCVCCHTSQVCVAAPWLS
jgi:hypothetical protein